MVGLWWKTLLKWMIRGYHYFRKHPYVCFKSLHIQKKHGKTKKLSKSDLQAISPVPWKIVGDLGFAADALDKVKPISGLVVSTHLKNISQIGSFPQVGMNIKNIWNHHPEYSFKWRVDGHFPWFSILVSERSPYTLEN